MVKGDGAMTANTLRPFVVISISYLLFTVTDGAIRMIVLLHAYNAGFSAMQVATMFTLYELAGVVTNLVAGFAGARLGIKCTLLTGLTLQLVSYGMLFAWPAIFDDSSTFMGGDSFCASCTSARSSCSPPLFLRRRVEPRPFDEGGDGAADESAAGGAFSAC